MRQARKIRETGGLSGTDVVRATSISLSHLLRFELGQVGLGLDKLTELAALYGCTIDVLVAEAEPEQAPA